MNKTICTNDLPKGSKFGTVQPPLGTEGESAAENMEIGWKTVYGAIKASNSLLFFSQQGNSPTYFPLTEDYSQWSNSPTYLPLTKE